MQLGERDEVERDADPYRRCVVGRAFVDDHALSLPRLAICCGHFADTTDRAFPSETTKAAR